MAKSQAPKKAAARKSAPNKRQGDRLQAICLALPEAEERETWESPTYRIRGKIFALDSAIEGRRAVWCKAPPGSQEVLVGADPARFVVPPYLGRKGLGRHVAGSPGELGRGGAPGAAQLSPDRAEKAGGTAGGRLIQPATTCLLRTGGRGAILQR